MGVVDELVRQERVQQRFHRRIGAAGDPAGCKTLNIDHVLVGQSGQRAQFEDWAVRRTAGSPAGSISAISQPEPLTHRTSVGRPRGIGQRRFDRGVAAAVQNQRRVTPAQQTRRMNAQRRYRHSRLAARSARRSVRRRCFGPETFHTRVTLSVESLARKIRRPRSIRQWRGKGRGAVAPQRPLIGD